ncbi:hypothetical protein BDV93DRAFT_509745 [Ceratobasidium sp. AG-I]|nr:hypothetical protein BDV93DRAFT_509745 [Ceratobasidium sp. AG-I]
MYTLSHSLEMFFFLRYHLLAALSKLTGQTVSFVPQWAITSKTADLQPALWDLVFGDFVVDDSRARKILGISLMRKGEVRYKNLWSTEQTIKWAVESLEGKR